MGREALGPRSHCICPACPRKHTMTRPKTVTDGRLTRASASLLNSFDPSTPFGCERRGWFKYVAGKTEPQTGNQELGVALHKMNEQFLLGKEPEPSIASELFEKGRLYLKNLRAAGVAMSIEAPIATEIAGVPFDGFCDLSLSTPILGQIIDWKTTSSIKKYGKTPEQLAKDAQMLIYARALHPAAEHVDLIHGQYQTKGVPTFDISTACVTKKEIDTRINSVIIPLVERIKGVVGEKDVTKLTRNPKACFNCPHRAYCPSDEAIQFMSIFSRYHATPAAPENPRTHPQMTVEPGPVPTPEVTAPTPPVEVELAPAPQPTPPPVDIGDRGDTPTSGALIQSNPLKRGRGRPPGSSKKVEFSAPLVPVESKENSLPPSAQTAAPTSIQFESVTFSYGATVNMGSFNSVRIDVSMTAKHTGDPDAAFQVVMDKVKEKVEAEMTKLAAAPKVGETK
ncbi:MAG: hypothetical protein E6R04_05950 [Spirochaetes bacterium]|nr:MAG: hypothetical protein E6R04_05950 [Spirochaetota bacterium]